MCFNRDQWLARDFYFTSYGHRNALLACDFFYILISKTKILDRLRESLNLRATIAE
jgi:hypothetical protein